MKVLLIKPPLYISRGMRNFISFPLPLGLLQIAAVLEQQGNQVQLLDCLIESPNNYEKIDQQVSKVGISWEVLKDSVRQAGPDLIGISNLFSAQADALLDTAKCCKQALPDTAVVAGGVHPTLAPLDCLKGSCVDYVGIGEGELVMPGLVRYLQGKLPENEALPVYFKQPSRARTYNNYPVVDNLDSLPLPAYHLVDFSKYSFAARYDRTVRGGTQARWASIITSRGCPFSCNFCNVPALEGKRLRVRSAAHILKEIELLYNNHQVRSFSFDDSNFTQDPLRAEEIMDLLIEKKLPITLMFPNGIRADSLTLKLVKKMKQAGCIEITLAFEHGHPDFLNQVIKKQLNLAKAQEVVRMIANAGIAMTGFFIFGMPGESAAVHRKNTAFIYQTARLGVIPNISLAMPLPSTELTQLALTNGNLERLPSPREYLLAANCQTLLKNLALPAKDYQKEIKRVFLRALLLVIIFQPKLFFRHPFMRSLITSLKSTSALKAKLAKGASLIGIR